MTKITTITALLLLLFNSVLVSSCKKEDTTPTESESAETNQNGAPSITKNYFLQALHGSEWMTTQTNTPIMVQTTDGFGWENLLSIITEESVELTIRRPGSSHTEGALQELVGQTISFEESSTSPYAYYAWGDQSSSYANSQSGSSLTINSVVADGSYGTYDSFKVSGVFNCAIASYSGEDVSVQSGTFTIRVTEYW